MAKDYSENEENKKLLEARCQTEITKLQEKIQTIGSEISELKGEGAVADKELLDAWFAHLGFETESLKEAEEGKSSSSPRTPV